MWSMYVEAMRLIDAKVVAMVVKELPPFFVAGICRGPCGAGRAGAGMAHGRWQVAVVQ
jgi:hypothetical protein